MNFPGITIMGNIISGEIIEKIRSEDIKYQQAADFGFDKQIRLREEIGIAWAAVRAHWTAFKIRRDKLAETDSGASETRASWVTPLMRELGYDLRYHSSSETAANGKTYHINHRDSVRRDFPVHIVGINQKLDLPHERGRFSPHALVQEYLNNTDHLYALVTNGQYLRLLRDANRLVKLAYLEFNLEKILEEELYSDFALMYRTIHSSRMPKDPESGQDAFIEYYHQESLASGSRIRERLSNAMELSLKELANGFLAHPMNEALSEIIKEKRLTPYNYFQYQLRLVYRVLFLFVTEERDLVYPGSDRSHEKKRSIYLNFYSMERLRRLALRLNYVDKRKYDLWEGVKTTFRLFEESYYGDKLGIKPLGHGLFAPDALGILRDCRLDNETLLSVIRRLTLFENEQKVQVRVNYGDLDVEEFGSVYEGLLEYEPAFEEVQGIPVFVFKEGDERSRTGSHYTPEELVKPLIKHSLDYLIEDKLKENDPEKGLLSLKICDVACGSGHILLSAARRVATELARVRTGEDQPSPLSFRKGIRDVIVNCIYGVDKNPLAVELCKVALWLEMHNPGEPLNFLDNHIKCGDSIVGLAHREELETGIATEAFKALPGDDKEIAALFAKKNRKERTEYEAKNTQLKADFDKSIDDGVHESMAEYRKFATMPESTPEEISAKEKAYNKFQAGKGRSFLKAMADLQVAQFFKPKTAENKEKLITDADYRQMLGGWMGWQDRKVAYANVIAGEKRFFHWFLEFPEVFDQGGFDCILGNPPYLGGTKISTHNGDGYFNYCKSYYFPASGRCDLVGYFVRRIFQIQKQNGIHSIITTNTIAEGDTREGGFDIIMECGGRIIYAEKGVIWPGKANVIVTLYSIIKGQWNRNYILSKKIVKCITAYLTEDSFITTPFQLTENEKKAFMGSSITGDGFLIDNHTQKSLVDNDQIYQEIVFWYVNGSDFNNLPNHLSTKRIINFFDLDLQIIKEKYPLALEIIERSVKPEREKKSVEVASAPWWKFWRIREELYSSISNNNRVLVLTRATSTHGLAFLSNDKFVYSDAVVVFSDDSFKNYSILQSSFHEDWSWRFSSRLKNDRRYSVTDAFETYPFPRIISQVIETKLEKCGELFHEHRRQLMLGMQLGLTKTYNLFHHNAIIDQNVDEYDKQVMLLQKHLEKTSGCIPINEAVYGILKLRELHVEMDKAVLEAYGWSDIDLRHDFYEVDYLPENDRVRYTIHPDARKEILKRLLDLNHKIHEEEVKAGLWDMKPSKEYKQKKKKSDQVKDEEKGYGGLFDLYQ